MKEAGFEALVVSLALNRRLHWYVSEAILEEYDRVLRYPRLGFLSRQVDRFLDAIHRSSMPVTPQLVVTRALHEPDNRFLECAEEAQADFLVTGNTRHFPARWKVTRVVNARQFIEQFQQRH